MKLKRMVFLTVAVSLLFSMFSPVVVHAEGNQNTSGVQPKPIECKFYTGDAFDPTCYVDKWIQNIATYLVNNSIKLIVKVVNSPRDLVDSKYVKQYYGYFADAAWAFILVFFMFHLVRILATYWIDDDVQKFKRLMVKLVVTAAMCGAYPTVFLLLMDEINSVTNGFANLGVHINNISSLFLVNEIQQSAVQFLFLLLGIALLVVAFQVTIRAAELAFMFITGPFAIATNINEDFNLFPAWWRGLLSLFIAQVVQVMLLILFIQLNINGIIPGRNLDSLESFILSIGFLFLIIKSPSFIKEYMYSTGTGQMMVGMTTRTAGAIGKEVMRRIVRK